MIPFNKPCLTGREMRYLNQALRNRKFSGDGPFSQKCHRWFEKRLGVFKALLTTSGTHSLDMAAMLVPIAEGDEVIMSSFTFTSTANAFVLRGAKIVFVDIRPDTMNMDETLLEKAVTPRTKAVVPMHYAGVACEMDAVMEVARKHRLFVVEDAAHAILSSYKDRFLGTIGQCGCFSFHETKNFTCGEGGGLLLNDPGLLEVAEIIREKGTNRSKFFRGEVDKYSWVAPGSSYLPGELNAAFLWAQLESADRITASRLESWALYRELLAPLEDRKLADLPCVPPDCVHNGHIFFIKVRDLAQRTEIIGHLKRNGIGAVHHYVPLHSARAGLEFGRFSGEDRWTTRESERLLRLPMYYGLRPRDVRYICRKVRDFFGL